MVEASLNGFCGSGLTQTSQAREPADQLLVGHAPGELDVVGDAELRAPGAAATLGSGPSPMSMNEMSSRPCSFTMMLRRRAEGDRGPPAVPSRRRSRRRSGRPRRTAGDRSSVPEALRGPGRCARRARRPGRLRPRVRAIGAVRLVGGDHHVGRRERQPLGQAHEPVAEVPPPELGLVQLGHDVVLVEDHARAVTESCTSRRRGTEVGRVADVHDVERPLAAIRAARAGTRSTRRTAYSRSVAREVGPPRAGSSCR